WPVIADGASQQPPRPWTVRQADGSTLELPSLRLLQERITDGTLGPADQISRSGSDWKELAEIAELAAFFEAARAVERAPYSQAPSSPPPSARPSAGPRQRYSPPPPRPGGSVRPRK